MIRFPSEPGSLCTEHSTHICQDLRDRQRGLLSQLYNDNVALNYLLIEIRDHLDRLNGTSFASFGLPEAQCNSPPLWPLEAVNDDVLRVVLFIGGMETVVQFSRDLILIYNNVIAKVLTLVTDDDL